MPVNLINQAEHLSQRACKDHVHPVFKVTLKVSKDPTAQILSSLLATPMPSQPLPGTLPAPGWQPSMTQAPPWFRHSAVSRRPGASGNLMSRGSSNVPYPTPGVSRILRQPSTGTFPGGNAGIFGEWGCIDLPWQCCDYGHYECYGPNDDESQWGPICRFICDHWVDCQACIWPW